MTNQTNSSFLKRLAFLFALAVSAAGCSRESDDSQDGDALQSEKFTPAAEVAANELAVIEGATTKAKGDTIQLVDLSNTPPDAIPKAVAAIIALRGVEEVRMKGSHIDDPAVLPVSGIRSLKRLRLTETRITDAVLEKLADRGELQLLHLQKADAITTEGLQYVGKITELKDLSLAGRNVDDSIVTAVAGLPKLKKLRLRGTAITGDNFDAIADSPVEDLELAETDFSNTGMPAIARMPRLTKLNLWLTKVTDEGLVSLTDMQQLVSLNLDNMPGITDASIDVILTLPKLTFLHLGKTKVTSAGVKRLSSLRELETLHVTNLGIPDDVLDELKNSLPNLKNLVN